MGCHEADTRAEVKHLSENFIITESNSMEEYLESTQVIDADNPLITKKAQQIIGEVSSDIKKGRMLFEWVRDEIPHSWDIRSEIVTCSASEVLLKSTGICFAKSHLLAALLRSAHIPAGFCYQVLTRTPPFTGMVLHGLNGVFIPGIGKWIRVDPRGNIGGIDAQFSLTEEKLAFPMDKKKGEFIYDEIFASPAPVVVDTLQKFSNLTEMWPHLPSHL